MADENENEATSPEEQALADELAAALSEAGDAGQDDIDAMLAAMGLSRERDVYLANAIKCRPPHNRDPQFVEQKCCGEWLQRQIALVDPAIIVCLGRIAATALIKDPFRITREHGQWFDVNGRRCMAIYHPSALLRDPSKRPETFVDLKALQREIYTRCPEVYPDA